MASSAHNKLCKLSASDSGLISAFYMPRGLSLIRQIPAEFHSFMHIFLVIDIDVNSHRLNN